MKVAIIWPWLCWVAAGHAICARECYGSRLDVDAAKVDLINRGQSYIKHIKQEAVEEALKEERLCASTDFSRIKDVEAVIICVPTPLSKNREPDISYVIETGESNRSISRQRGVGGLGIDNLSRNDRRGVAGCIGRGIGNESRFGFSPGLLPGTGRSRLMNGAKLK